MRVEVLFIETIALSSLVYLYLHHKTRISLKYLYLDNIAVILPVGLLAAWLDRENIMPPVIIAIFIIPFSVPALAFTYTMIRFWRTPWRKVTAEEGEIISPADGNIIYIKKLDPGSLPVAVKKGKEQQLRELAQAGLTDQACWHIGINMTPFDVHKNCSPIQGKIALSEHYHGKFLSLKDPEAMAENERHSYIIENGKLKIGIVQIASRLVRRIDSYVQLGGDVKPGQWLGMIRFGSQVDLILPLDYKPVVEVGMQVYAAKTVLAESKAI